MSSRRPPLTTPLRIHPDNPKILEYADRPLILLSATEHYGAVSRVKGDLKLNLPEQAYQIRFISPISGAAVATMALRGSADTVIPLPSFEHDLFIEFTRP